MRYRFIFSVLLFGTVIANATSINVTTKYGDTGGIVGPLNSTSDKINGRTICPTNPTAGCDFSNNPGFNNNGTVDDPSDDSYDGDLLVRTNDAFQAIAAWNWNNGIDDVVTITGTLPLKDGNAYYEWTELPGSCDLSTSTISEDKQTIVCVRKDFDKADVGTKAEDLTFNVRVLGGTPSGTQPGDITFKIEADGATAVTDTTDGYSLTVTAAPRWNLDKSMFTTLSGKEYDIDGDGVMEKGWILDYKFYIESDEVSGETDSVNPIVGNESMGEDATFTFTDDLSGLPPHSTLIGCGFTGGYNRPNQTDDGDSGDGYDGSSDPLTFSGEGSIYGDKYPERHIPQKKNEQTLTCTQNGNSIAIRAEHIDATLNHYPTKDYLGRDLPVNRAIAAIGNIYIFIPLEDVKNGKNGVFDNCDHDDPACDDGEYATLNVLKDFDPTTPTGKSNFGDDIESEKDNTYSRTLYYASGSWSKRFRGGGNVNYNGNDGLDYVYGWTGTGNRSGDGMVTKGAEFSTWIATSNSGGTPFTEDTTCDVIDAYRLKIQPIKENKIYTNIGARYTGGVDLPYRYYIWNDDGNYTDGMSRDANNLNDDPIPYIVEYATTYVDDSFLPSKGGDTTVDHRKDIERECTDSSVQWTTNFEDAMSGPIGITKVRIRLKPGVEVPAGSGMYFWLNHKIRDIDLATNKSMNNNDLIVNYAGHKFNFGNWYWPDYIPGTFPGNPSGWNGDRVIYTGPKVRIKKYESRTAASLGDEVTYRLEMSYTNDTGLYETGQVNVADVLPKDFKYIKGSVTPLDVFGEPTIGRCSDVLDINVTPCVDGENQVLLWDLGEREVNAPQIEDLEYKALIGAAAKVGINTNVVKIESPTDASEITQRRAEVGLSIDVPASINIVKTTEENSEYPSKRERTTDSKDIFFLMDLRNGKEGNVTDLDIIDILPFKGDGEKVIPFNNIFVNRKVPTSYHGTAFYHEASFGQHPGSSSACDYSGKIKYYYTNEIPTKINLAPTVGSANDVNSEDSIWCEGDESGPNGCSIPSSNFTFTDNSEVTAVRVRNATMETQAICQFRVSLTVKDNLAGDNYSNSAGASATGVTLPVLSNSIAVPIVGSSIGDRVWYDKNTNGIQDDDEVGVAGITVHLLDENGEPVSNPVNPNADYIVKTDSNGNYSFEKLNSGNYSIIFDLPEKFVGTEKGAGGNSSIDSNIASNGKTGLISLGVEEHDFSIDAGVYKLITLGDTVWYDNNHNGVQDPTESGVNGVKVTLYDEVGNIVKTTITDEKGVYLFRDILPGKYIVGFTDLPAGYGITKKDATVDTEDSDVDPTTGKTDLIVVDTQDNLLDIDMGIYKNDLAILGDTVWFDDNKDGIQDSTERGVMGVEVTLYNTQGEEVKQTVTDAQGSYLFRDIIPEAYTVGFSNLPLGYQISPKDTTSESLDSDVNPATGKTDTITLHAGENNLNSDMGIYSDKLAMVGDRVWFDDNQNGKQDSTEKGVEGVEVTLFDATGTIVETTVTNATGTYLFRDLTPGDYQLEFTNLPATYHITKKDIASDTLDSDVNPSSGRTDTITLKYGDTNLDVDMGIYNDKLATLGDTVWFDDNKDGIQNPMERGVSGVKVTLFDFSGDVVATTVTNREGHYLFRDIIPGTYSVGFSNLPASYKILPKDKDSKVDPLTGKSDAITLVAGDTNLDIDMGIYNDKLATLGDTVWYDDNKNGVQDDMERGVNGVKVTLFDANGSRISSVVTDKQGNYLFRDLVAGVYSLEFTDLPATYVISPKDRTSDSLDSDIEPSTGKSDVITLVVGENKLDVDMGIYNDKLSTLGDTVWYDDNKDSKQDATEKGVPGVRVTLFDVSGKEIASTITDDSGNYLFRNLVAGKYSLGFTDLPASYQISQKNSDSKADPVTGKSDLITLSIGENNLDVDIGIYNDKLATLGDTVWYDDNRNGIQDDMERGVVGVKVVLFNSNGDEVVSTVTDKYGNYIFRDLLVGSYRVGFTNLPIGYFISPKDKGIDDSKDSDADEISGKTDTITLTAGENNLDVDMGIYAKHLVTIGDTVWYDDNRNGRQDRGERGAEAVKVTLFNSSGEVVATTTTDRNGLYQFRGVVSGVYSLGFTELPVDYLIVPKKANSVVNPQTAKTVTFEVKEGDIELSMDMGIYTNSLGAIGDTVWYDDNHNGIQDITERGVEAIKVTLLSESGTTVAITTTDANGNYQFRDLSAGTYRIEFSDLPMGYYISEKDKGDDYNDSDVNVGTGRTDLILLNEGSYNLTVDMGIYREDRAVVGNSVWYDDNRNGIQDITERGAKALKVELFSSSGILVAATTTDENGHYQFRNLVAGNYYIKLSDLPVGYEITKQNEGSDDNDSDIDAFGKTAIFTINEGDVITNIDMGIFNRQRATIGSHVWYDDNRNGIQDSFEKGVEAVKVTLYDESNNLVSTTTTDSAGLYQFRDLLAGSYHIGFSELPVGYKITLKNAEGDRRDSEDSDADESGNTVVTILSEGENDMSWDMGIYNSKRASIGDVVWYDDNKDGIQDINEFGVNAVKVTLHRADESVVATTVTDTKGNYKFGNLLPGDYYVEFSDLPVGYRATMANNGSDYKDSDADISTLRTEITRLEAGENDLSWDMGIHNELRASIGNTVWYDDNKNGQQDAYEFGVGAVKVTLYTDRGRKVAETLTDERGNYAFRNLLPDTYYIKFSELPSGYEVTSKNSISDTTKDSDVDSLTLRTDMIHVEAGENDLSWDMGLFSREGASLGNKVWFDSNHDGLQDITEKGVSAVKVTLFDKDNNVVKTTRTNEYGEYIFRDLVPGEYYVGFSEFPATYMITKQNVHDDWKEDSDANYHRGQTIHTVLEAGENDLSWDVGLYVPTLVNIGDRVWYDENGNGIQDKGEKGVKNVRVTLIKDGVPQIPSEQITTATTSLLTDENGAYLFENIEAFAPHKYHVVFDQDTLPKDFLITKENVGDNREVDSDANPKTGATKDVILTSEDDLTWDMGIQTLHVNDDTVVANTEGPVTIINVLENDNGDINHQTIKFIETNRGEVLWSNGTAVAGANRLLTDTLVVPGEGVWSVQDGKITFRAEDGFEGIPTPIYYVVEGNSGEYSNVGQVKFTTPCTCETYTSGENSVPSLSYWSMLIILLTISTLGGFFARREFPEEIK